MPGTGAESRRTARAIRVLATLAVGAALAAATLAGGWGLQRTALGAPSASSRTAVGVIRWFARYRLAESEIRVAGRPAVRGVCLSGWLPAPTRVGVDRGVLLELDDGTTLLAEHRGLEVLAAPTTEPRLLQLVQLQLAGCTRELGGRLAAAVQTPGGVRVARDRSTVTVRIATARTRLAVVADRRTLVPFAVEVRGGGYAGRSRIALTRLEPGRLGEILRRAGLR